MLNLNGERRSKMNKECSNCLYGKNRGEFSSYCFLDTEYKDSDDCCERYKCKAESTKQEKKELIMLILKGAYKGDEEKQMDDYDIYRMNLLAHAIIELNEKAGHVIDPDRKR